jgi:hypothetical protein
VTADLALFDVPEQADVPAPASSHTEAPDRETGRRTVRTEWGNRYPHLGELGAGGVELASDEAHARDRAAAWAARQYRADVAEAPVVTRQVATYTTNWRVTP